MRYSSYCTSSPSLWIVLLVVVVNLAIHGVLSHSSKAQEEHQNIINLVSTKMVERYDEGAYRYPNIIDPTESRILKTCYNYFMCEAFPSSQLNRVVFNRGEVATDLTHSKNIEAVEHIEAMIAAKRGRLPSCLVSLGDNSYDFIAGPRLTDGQSSTCRQVRNETALFVFPWETHNAFHALNDNTFAVLSQLLLHRLLHAHHSHQPGRSAAIPPYHVYRFARFDAKEPTTMFKLIDFLFHDANTNSRAAQLLRGGPHCEQSAVWGSPVKVFHRDSLFNFRAEQYLFLRSLAQARIPSLPSSESRGRRLKVVIVSRRDTAAKSVGTRKLSGDSEQRLAQFFEAQGADVTVCCDFAQLNSMEKFVAAFWEVDVCVGIHGAGMINCVFGRPGLVVVELQGHHAFGLETFMRMAHMARGHYVFYDLRTAPKISAPTDAGAHLNQALVERIVHTSLALARFSRRRLPEVEARLHPRNMSAPEPRLLHRHTRSFPADSGRVFAFKPPLSGAQIQRMWFTHELVLDFRAQRLYYDQQQGQQAASVGPVGDFVANELRLQLRRGKNEVQVDAFAIQDAAQYRPIGHAMTTLRNLDNEGDVQRRFVDHRQQRRKRPSFSHIDEDFSYVAAAEHQELWVFFNPALFEDFPRVSALGPLFEDAYAYCIRLPYFKFRMMTQPWMEHRAECDRHYVYRKRSGRNDNALLGKLLD